MTLTTYDKHEAQFAALSQVLLKQKASGIAQEETLAVMFMGEQFDSYPRELLIDNTITSLDKYAWQRLYIELQQNRHYFPSYDNLQLLWGNLGGLLSRKTVREVLSRLVLSGWLSFRVLRGDNGQMVGNIYMLHNIRLPLIDIITQNDESVTHIFTSLLSKKDISKSLAILTYNQVKAYLASKGQSEQLFLQMNGKHKEMVITHNIDDIASSLLAHLETRLGSKKELGRKSLSSNLELGQNSLSSEKELGQNSLSSEKELGQNSQSSHLELSQKLPSSKKELPIKSVGYEASSSTSSTSSKYSSTTGDEFALVVPENIKARLSDKGMRDICNVIAKTQLDVMTVNQIFASVSQGNIGSIKSMTAYLVRNIQKAARGEYTVVSPQLSTIDTKQKPPSFAVVDNAEREIKKQTVSKQRVNELFGPLKDMLSTSTR